MANFPFKYPITLATEYFGGIHSSRWTWSGCTFNSRFLTLLSAWPVSRLTLWHIPSLHRSIPDTDILDKTPNDIYTHRLYAIVFWIVCSFYISLVADTSREIYFSRFAFRPHCLVKTTARGSGLFLFNGCEGETATFLTSYKRPFLTLSKSPSRTINFIDFRSSKTYPENKVSKAVLI
jgi:hypothetical protein